MKQSDRRVRGLAASQLGELGAKAVDALPELERLAKDDPDQNVRERAKASIDKIRAATGASAHQ